MQQTSAIYVHIPFCKARCGYCAFSSCVNFDLQERYFDALLREIDEATPSSCVETMFWGGGTPSAVDVKYLQMLFQKLSQKFDLSHLQEFTVECNPESTTEELLGFFRKIGVNRLSFGLQSANDQTLKRIGRLHTYRQFLNALNMALAHGFSNVNADLILGLPESESDFQRTVCEVCQLPLKHVSLYALEIHDENTNFKKICQSFSHSDDQLADMYDFAMQKFAKKGFLRYEVSNFAQDGFACEHNCAYWKEQRYYGFGASASGFLQNVRYTNVFSVREYVNANGSVRAFEEQISAQEEACEFVMLGLRLQQGISLAEFSKRFSSDFFAAFPASEGLLKNGFLQLCDGRISVPPDKFYVLNSILVELLPNL